MIKSTLYLVGAGPGDPELITVKAVRILSDADVVLYDALANPDLLRHCKSGAELVFVGKRYGCHAFSQSEINELIIEKGRMYKRVVRLKGGDPFVFARAQEEIQAARTNGMEIQIVPGVSSALAVPAMQEIPLTCRGISESFWVTTGTTKEGTISADIKYAAQSGATVVILMAMSKLDAIMEIFAEYGKSEIPVAIIQSGTTKEEKLVIGKVKDIAFRAAAAELSNPAIIVVGEVVNARPTEWRVMVQTELNCSQSL